MANTKISALPNATPLAGTEAVPLVQSGATVQTTAQDIADLSAGAVSSVNGQTGVVVLTAADVGALSNATPVTLTQGGTGQTTANAALNALLPTQTGQNGKFLSTNGSNASWQTASGGSATVTLGASAPYVNRQIATTGTMFTASIVDTSEEGESITVQLQGLLQNTTGNPIDLVVAYEFMGFQICNTTPIPIPDSGQFLSWALNVVHTGSDNGGVAWQSGGILQIYNFETGALVGFAQLIDDSTSFASPVTIEVTFTFSDPMTQFTTQSGYALVMHP